MNQDLKEIFDQFQADGTFLSGAPYGSGHIHDTFLIETAENDKDNYILQRLNNRIFKNIPQLQDNIERVTLHLRKKLQFVPGANIKRECLTLISARDGKTGLSTKMEASGECIFLFQITIHIILLTLRTKHLKEEKPSGGFRQCCQILEGVLFMRLFHGFTI